MDDYSMFTQARFAQAAYQTNRPKTLFGYTYVPGESDDRSAIYTKDGFVEVAYRGSVDGKDWLKSDTAIAFGNQRDDSTFIHDREQLAHLKDLYSGDKFYFTGHSLGGARAYASARTSKDRAATFNAAIGVTKQNASDAFRTLLGDKNLTGITNYRTEGDLVSMNPVVGGRSVVIKKGANSELTAASKVAAHDLDNFLPKSSQ